MKFNNVVRIRDVQLLLLASTCGSPRSTMLQSLRTRPLISYNSLARPDIPRLSRLALPPSAPAHALHRQGNKLFDLRFCMLNS